MANSLHQREDHSQRQTYLFSGTDTRLLRRRSPTKVIFSMGEMFQSKGTRLLLDGEKKGSVNTSTFQDSKQLFSGCRKSNTCDMLLSIPHGDPVLETGPLVMKPTLHGGAAVKLHFRRGYELKTEVTSFPVTSCPPF